MGTSPIDAISGGYKKASSYLAGFGTKDFQNNIKKLLFEQNGQIAAGYAPTHNTGSTFGYGFAANSHTLGGTQF